MKDTNQKTQQNGPKKRGRKSKAEIEAEKQQALNLGDNGNNPSCDPGALLLDRIEKTGDQNKTGVDTPKLLPVEIHFPQIYDLKQGISIDTKGFLILKVAFSAKLDNTFELFRLASLLKQKGINLFATIGCNQAAMDFAFNADENTFSVILPDRPDSASTQDGELDPSNAGENIEDPGADLVTDPPSGPGDGETEKQCPCDDPNCDSTCGIGDNEGEGE